jgi:hypothetical protein
MFASAKRRSSREGPRPAVRFTSHGDDRQKRNRRGRAELPHHRDAPRAEARRTRYDLRSAEAQARPCEGEVMPSRSATEEDLRNLPALIVVFGKRPAPKPTPPPQKEKK